MDLRRAFAVSAPCPQACPLFGDVRAGSLVLCSVLLFPWQTLRLDANTATLEDVTAAYKRLALKCHPDKPSGNTATFQALNSAYQACKKHLEEDDMGMIDGDDEHFYFSVFVPKHVAEWLDQMVRQEREREQRMKDQLRRRLESKRHYERPEAKQYRRLREDLQDLLRSAQGFVPVANRIRTELNALKRAEATLDDDHFSLQLGRAEQELTKLKIQVNEEISNAWSRQAEAAMERQRLSEEHIQQKIQQMEEKALREQKAEEERKEWEVCERECACAFVCRPHWPRCNMACPPWPRCNVDCTSSGYIG